MGEHSKAYDEFIKQIDATGYQKAQGYDPELLSKINDNECEKVEELILKLYQNGDRQVVNFLPKLKKVDGLALLKNEIIRLPVPSLISAEYANILLKETGDSHYEEILIQNLKISNKMERNIVVRFLLTCKPSEKLYGVFENLVNTDSSSLVRFNAAAGILYCKGLLIRPLDIDNQNPFREIIVGLSSVNEVERSKAWIKLNSL